MTKSRSIIEQPKMVVQKKYSQLIMLPLKIGGSSMTTPDQALTIQEIMQRSKNGGVIPTNKWEAVYNGDIVLPDVSKMDFTDLEEYRQVLTIKKMQVEKEYKEYQEATSNMDKPTFDDRLLSALEKISERSEQLDLAKNPTK